MKYSILNFFKHYLIKTIQFHLFIFYFSKTASFLLPNTQQHKVFTEIQDVFASTEMTKENLKYKKKKKVPKYCCYSFASCIPNWVKLIGAWLLPDKEFTGWETQLCFIQHSCND